MTTTLKAKYLRTEPPALLIEPLTLTLDAVALEELNKYRQAEHAYFSSNSAAPDHAELGLAYARAAEGLAGKIAMDVRFALDEPLNWDQVES